MKCRAVRKITNLNGTTAGYLLQDDFGNTQEMTSQDIKQAIKGHKISVYNLDITTDGKLIQIAKYDKLGLCVPPSDFFRGTLDDWHVQHLNTGNYVMFTQGYKQITLEYALTPDKTKYILRIVGDTNSNNYVTLSRIDRAAIDGNAIQRAIWHLEKVQKEYIQKNKSITKDQTTVIQYGPVVPIDLESYPPGYLCIFTDLHNCPYRFIERRGVGTIRIQPEDGGEAKNYGDDDIAKLVKSSILEVIGLGVEPNGNIIIDPHVRTPERNPIYTEQVISEAIELREAFEEKCRLRDIEERKQRKLQEEAEQRRLEASQKGIRGVFNSFLNMLDDFSSSSSSQPKKPTQEQIINSIPNLGARHFYKGLNNLANKDKK